MAKFADVLYAVINALTADASPDAASDYVMTVDASGSALKKVLLEDLPGGSSTPTIKLMGRPAGTLLRSYTFDSTTESWEAQSGVTLANSNGRLSVTGTGGQYAKTALEPSGAADVADGEVYLTLTMGSQAAGIAFRQTDASNGYHLYLSPVNENWGVTAALYKCVAGTDTGLAFTVGATGTPSNKAMVTNADAVIKVLVRFVGGQLQVFINDAHIMTVNDTTFTTGRIGAVANGTTSPFFFDNLKVYSLSGWSIEDYT
jgi:hypothetical protein